MLKNRLWNRVAVVSFLLGSIVLTGCAGKADKAVKPQVEVTEQKQRPPLAVPAKFESEQAKRDFAIQAVDNGYYAEVKKILEETAAVEPNPIVFQRLGTTNYNLDDYSSAITAWTKAGEMDPAVLGEMHNNIGNALRDSKQYKEAEAAYRKALEIEPSRSTAATNLASLLKMQGQLKAAVTVLTDAAPHAKEGADVAALLKAYQEELKNTPNG